MSRNTIGRLLTSTLLLSGFHFGLTAPTAHAQLLEWVRQIGTSQQEFNGSVSADGLGSVYISGSTPGNLGGPNAGGNDAFASKYDAAGNLLWTEQLGTDSDDGSGGVSADGLGNVYISGYTFGSLGGPNLGQSEAFVSKYDAAGALQWIRQLHISYSDASSAVSADGLGNVYVSGSNGFGGGDAFVSKYDAAGNFQWTRQLTDFYNQSRDVSADGLGSVYISGYTDGSLGGPFQGGYGDAFIAKYDAAGNLLWTKQLGTTGTDVSQGVSADGLGSVYISGYTEGNLGGPNAGGTDAFVAKYDTAGNLLWTRQFGTSAYEESDGVSADAMGNVYVSGGTLGSLDGPNAGIFDAFVSKYDAAGNLQWIEQLGTSAYEAGEGVSADGLGNVYISGWTRGSLGGPNAGFEDVFVAKYSDFVVPEPGSWLLAVLASAAVLWIGKRPHINGQRN